MKRISLFIITALISGFVYGQENPFEKLDFLIGEWSGEGEGFGNNKSKIESSFQYVMGGTYIEVVNESKFDPTERNPDGEHHIDKGYISYDGERKLIVFRQFNNEGFINQYVLNEALYNDSTIVFESEMIENLSSGKARWTIKKKSKSEFVTIFDVSFTGDEFTCLGTNYLKRED